MSLYPTKILDEIHRDYEIKEIILMLKLVFDRNELIKQESDYSKPE